MAQNIKIPIRIINIEQQIENIKKWKISEKDKKDIPIFLRDLEIGKITGNQITAGTLNSYLTNLKIGLTFMKKQTLKLTQKDTERLCEALLKDELKYVFKKKDETSKTINHKKPFAETTKLKIKDSVIKYLEWKLKSRADKLTKILRVKPKLKEPTPDYLKESQVERLFKACKTAEERFLVAVLFDSGARAEEFHNIRREDVELPNETGFVKLTLKEEYSKTKGRVIGLFWIHSLEAVQDYLKERIQDGIKPDEPIFKRNYKASRKFLQRLGKRILNRNIYYHLFRHSSATYYADKLNRQELCIRYGWRFRSPMPDRYINRSGVEKDLEEKFEQTELQTLKKKFEKDRQESKIKQDNLEKENQEFRIRIKRIEKQFNLVLDEGDSTLEVINNQLPNRKPLFVIK